MMAVNEIFEQLDGIVVLLKCSDCIWDDRLKGRVTEGEKVEPCLQY